MSEENIKQPTDNVNSGSQPTTTPLLERADSVAKRLEEANKKTEELLKRQEEIAARAMLSGRSEAGIMPKAVSKDDEVKARVNEMLKPLGRKI